jgi:hypothetical protein
MASEQTLSLVLKVDDQGSVVLDRFTKKIQETGNSIQTSLSVIAAGAATQLAVAAQQIEQTGLRYMELGARALSIQDSFNTITKASGIMGETLIENIKSASGVFVESTAIMVKAQQLLVEGFKPDQIVAMTEAARVAARKMGTDVAEAWDLVTQAIITGRTRGLRAAFPMNEQEMMEKYAASIGTVVPLLTEHARQQAILNEVLKQTIDYTQQYGALQETESEKLQQAVSWWKSLAIQIGQAALNLGKYVMYAGQKAAGYAMAGGMLEPGAPTGAELPTYPTTSERRFGGWGAASVAGQASANEQRLIKQKEFNDAYTKLADEYQVKIQSIGDKGYQNQLQLIDQQQKAAEDAIQKQWGASMLAKVVPLIDEYYDKQREEVEKKYGMKERLAAATTAAEALYQGPFPQESIPGLPTAPVLTDTEAAFLAKYGAGSDYLAAQNKVAQQYADLVGDIDAQIAAMKSEADQYAFLQVATGKWSDETAAKYKQVVDIQAQQLSTTSQLMKSVGTEMAEQWSKSMADVITGQQSFGDAMKKMWLDLADYIIQQILRTLAMQALFGNQKGTIVSGTGLIGSIVRLIGLQEGGLFTRPTPALIGEAGPEAVVPLKGGKIPIEGGQGGSTTTIVNQIYATDVKSFEDQLNRNPAAIINILAKSVKGGGKMRDVIRSA